MDSNLLIQKSVKGALDQASGTLTWDSAGWRFDNSYARLPEAFFSRLRPVRVREPRMVLLDRPLADFLGLNVGELTGEEGALILSGNRIPELPLESASTDTIVTTFTLRSVASPEEGLRQMCRVLKPGGTLIYCEHGAAPDRAVRR